MRLIKQGYTPFNVRPKFAVCREYSYGMTNNFCYQVSTFWSFKKAKEIADSFNDNYIGKARAVVFKEHKLLKPYRVLIFKIKR